MTPNPPYVPVLTGGGVVDALWRHLLDRAGHRPGVPLTEDADLHLLVNGRRVDARSRAGGRHIFDLPPHPVEIRIASRSASPAELGLARDPRILGVALKEIKLWRGAKLRVLPASNPLLVTGFNTFEPDKALRWTDGGAVLPTDFFGDFGHGAELEVLTCGAMRYALEG